MIAAGEQRAIDTGERIVYEKKIAHRVFAIEDYLASGAVICHSKLMRSAEAEVCALAFESARDRLKEILLNSFSGRYLVQHKLEEDVEFAVRLNQYAVIPVIHKGKIEILDR